MKIIRPIVIVVRILRVQARISQAHESVFHLARREYGLGGNDFALRVDAIWWKEDPAITVEFERNEFNDPRACIMDESNEASIRVFLHENSERGYDNFGDFSCL